MRLIDADEIVIELTKQKAHFMSKASQTSIEANRMMYINTATGIQHALNTIDNAPTVCVDNYSMGYQDGVKKVLSERPKGEWIETKGEYVRDNIYKVVLKCSNCGHICSYYGDVCGNCGAKMRPKANQLRDCENCIHHSDNGCEVWECEFEKRSDL